MSTKTFESIRQINEDGIEFWHARELQSILEYSRWEKFKKVIEKAIVSCAKAGQEPENHFHQVVQMVQLGSGSKRQVDDYQLSRYACYLIVQNGDPSKEVIANGQTYFAIQTRKQELANDESFKQLNENQKRLYLRNDLINQNKELVQTAQQAGVKTNLDFAVFQNHGYRGLYGGMDAQDIHKHKGLKEKEKFLDHMGSVELAANLFRATQTEDKIRRENIQGKEKANQTHFEVGSKVRQTIKELGGTMPENLPTPTKCIKQIEQSIEIRAIE